MGSLIVLNLHWIWFWFHGSRVFLVFFDLVVICATHGRYYFVILSWAWTYIICSNFRRPCCHHLFHFAGKVCVLHIRASFLVNLSYSVKYLLFFLSRVISVMMPGISYEGGKLLSSKTLWGQNHVFMNMRYINKKKI